VSVHPDKFHQVYRKTIYQKDYYDHLSICDTQILPKHGLILEDQSCMSRKKTTESNNKLSRRDFARNAALLAAAATVPSGLSVHAATAQTPAKLSPEGEAQYQTIIAKYGDRLSTEQKADIRRLIGDSQKGVAALRAFPLDNADEPANMFRVTESKRR
jgi:hypothetical protein